MIVLYALALLYASYLRQVLRKAQLTILGKSSFQRGEGGESFNGSFSVSPCSH